MIPITAKTRTIVIITIIAVLIPVCGNSLSGAIVSSGSVIGVPVVSFVPVSITVF